MLNIFTGDGLTDPISQFSTYDVFSYSVGLLDEKQKAVVAQYQDQIVKSIQQGNYLQAMSINDNLTDYTINQCAGGVNVYDIRTYQDYDFSAYIKFVNLAQTKKMMHTEGVPYFDFNPDVWNNLLNDVAKSVKYKVEALLDCPTRKLRVLLYNGQFDWIVNYIGANKWIDSMKWHGSSGFLNDEGKGRKGWKVDNTMAGYVHQFDNLIQLVVLGAGHLSPMNQPRNVLEMVKTFTQNREF